jgi:hypothetical protein
VYNSHFPFGLTAGLPTERMCSTSINVMGRFEFSCAITETKANVTSNTVVANRRVLIMSPSELNEEGRMELEESAEEHGTKVDDFLQDCPIFREFG